MKTITLSGGKAAGRVALIDDEDFDLVSQHTWHVQERLRPGYLPHGPYAAARRYIGNGRGVKVYMHKLITGWPLTDHVNRDGLDNRRANLRPANRAQNLANQQPRPGCASPYRGVVWSAQKNKWMARIKADGKQRYLGSFTSEIDAAVAYDVAAREVFGEFACPNFP